ncbi:MAG TPA: DUF1461 domain-containing protein [Candidatus Limnocylindrales bacterium]
MSWLLPPATALVIIVVGVLLLTTSIWMHFAIPAAGGGLPGYPIEASLVASDRTVRQLLGLGDFLISVECPGAAPCPPQELLYTADEQAHLRDARAVLYLFVALAVASLAFVIAALAHRPHDARRWRAVARGGAGLAIGAVVVGVVGYLVFDAAFELFHRVLFPGGNWEFPADSNMIRLYPYAFWQLTAAALGMLSVIGGGLVWWLARRRAASLAE